MDGVKLTVSQGGPGWEVVFERREGESCRVARFLFDEEPSDGQLYRLILRNFNALRFDTPEEAQLAMAAAKTA